MTPNLLDTNTSFKHTDKLQAIGLAERNSANQNRRKAITVQHFSDNGQPDSPAETVICEAGHSPVAIQSLNGGYYVAKENDPEVGTQQWQDRQDRQQREYQQR